MSKLLIDEPPLQVLPSLAAAVGLEESIVLQQIHYKLRLRDPAMKEWLPISLQTLIEWCPFVSRRTMQRIVSSLKAQGLLEVAQHGSFDRTNWFRVCYEKVESIAPNGAIDGANFAPSHGAKSAPTIAPDRGHLSYQESLRSEDQEEKKKPASRGCPLPPDFRITEERTVYATKRLPNVDAPELMEAFRDYHSGKGTIGKDWDAFWRNYVRNAVKFGYPMIIPSQAPREKQIRFDGNGRLMDG